MCLHRPLNLHQWPLRAHQQHVHCFTTCFVMAATDGASAFMLSLAGTLAAGGVVAARLCLGSLLPSTLERLTLGGGGSSAGAVAALVGLLLLDLAPWRPLACLPLSL